MSSIQATFNTNNIQKRKSVSDYRRDSAIASKNNIYDTFDCTFYMSDAEVLKKINNEYLSEITKLFSNIHLSYKNSSIKRDEVILSFLFDNYDEMNSFISFIETILTNIDDIIIDLFYKDLNVCIKLTVSNEKDNDLLLSRNTSTMNLRTRN